MLLSIPESTLYVSISGFPLSVLYIFMNSGKSEHHSMFSLPKKLEFIRSYDNILFDRIYPVSSPCISVQGNGA